MENGDCHHFHFTLDFQTIKRRLYEMGVYTEYLDKHLDPESLTKERKLQLKAISNLRQRDVLVFAANLNQERAAIGYDDLLPINDQLANLSGEKLDFIIETPGGSGEVAEDIVELLHDKYKEVSIIVPGYAKSAGTIITMAGNEILMGPTSALGPIDAQIIAQGKRFSAEALLQGIEKIKAEVTESGSLNKAYIPILQGVSPGEIQNAQNALNFAKKLVTEWLAKYKFENWTTHSNGAPVSMEEKEKRAEEIASKLCNHSHWLTHGRSIKISDLTEMKLQIVDYSTNAKLYDAINRYYTLLQMTFQSNIYKVFETPNSQIYRMITEKRVGENDPQTADNVSLEQNCATCGKPFKIQANLEKNIPLAAGHIKFPPTNMAFCPSCHKPNDLSKIRKNIEQQTGKKIV